MVSCPELAKVFADLEAYNVFAPKISLPACLHTIKVLQKRFETYKNYEILNEKQR